MALPAGFGKQRGDLLLVGNFGSGTIMIFDAKRRFRGLLNGPRNHAIVTDGFLGLRSVTERAGVSVALTPSSVRKVKPMHRTLAKSFEKALNDKHN